MTTDTLPRTGASLLRPATKDEELDRLAASSEASLHVHGQDLCAVFEELGRVLEAKAPESLGLLRELDVAIGARLCEHEAEVLDRLVIGLYEPESEMRTGLDWRTTRRSEVDPIQDYQNALDFRSQRCRDLTRR